MKKTKTSRKFYDIHFTFLFLAICTGCAAAVIFAISTRAGRVLMILTLGEGVFSIALFLIGFGAWLAEQRAAIDAAEDPE